jgi:cytochrome c5
MKWLACLLTIVVGAAHATESVDGKQAFNARCQKCHGESGTATFMLARRIGKEKAPLESRSDLAPEFIRHVVRNGIVSMPAITRVEVTDAELRAITQYLTRPRP